MGLSKKKKQPQQEVTLSKPVICLMIVGFVVVSVGLGFLMSFVMEDNNPDAAHTEVKNVEGNRGFSAADGELPGLNDPLFEIRSTHAVDPVNGTKMRDFCTGGHFTAALDAEVSGRIWMWGLLSHGARVLETAAYIEIPANISEIACGSFQILVRTEDGAVFTLGTTPRQMCVNGANPDQEPIPPENDTVAFIPKMVDGLQGVGPIVQMAAGFNSNAFLTADGKLYFQGVKAQGPFPYKDAGECLENATLAPMPPGMKRITRLSLGSHYTGVLAESEDADGKTCTHVFFAGINAFGAMGMAENDTHGEWVEAKLPAKLYGCEAKNEVVELSCGGDHALLRTRDGTVLGSGWNENGQLGTHDKEDRKEFEPLPLGENLPETAKQVKQIVAGPYSASLLVWNDGTLSSAGSVDMSGRGGDYFKVVKVDNAVRSIGVKKADSAFMHAGMLLNDGTLRLYGNAILGHIGIVIPREELARRFGKRE